MIQMGDDFTGSETISYGPSFLLPTSIMVAVASSAVQGQFTTSVSGCHPWFGAYGRGKVSRQGPQNVRDFTLLTIECDRCKRAFFFSPGNKTGPFRLSDAGANVAAARSSGAPAGDFPAAEHWSHATEAAKRGSAHGFLCAVCFPAHSLAHGDSAGTACYAQIVPVEYFAENAACSAAFACVAHSAAASV